MWLFTDFCHPDEGGDTFPETSGLTRATRHNIPEDAIRHVTSFVLDKVALDEVSFGAYSICPHSSVLNYRPLHRDVL
jgi:hypothetical protein